MSEQEMLDMIREAGFLTGGTGEPVLPFAMPVYNLNCLPQLKKLINLAFQQGKIYERQI
jgi:hypothetical protein